MGLLIVGVSFGNESTRVISWSGALGVLFTIFVLLGLDQTGDIVMNGMFKMDAFAGFLKLIILVGVIASIALSVRYLIQQGAARFEYPVLIMLAAVGMMLMVSANNMLMLYVGLELQSLSLYVLAAFRRNSLSSAEAGVKYFVLGALSSGLLLFGISLIYGFTGSIDFGAIQVTLLPMEQVPVGVVFGLVFILAGLAFKVSAVPFHMWTPDVYQGAPTSVTAFFAIVPKIAAIGLLTRLLIEPFGVLVEQWVQILYFLALASMTVGAFAGIAQSSIKRLLAYSSIGNMGYAMIGLIAASETGISAVLLYMMIYMVMTAGVFAVILSVNRGGKPVDAIDGIAGLSKTNPIMAYAMAVLMLSMAGIPPFAGFFGKLAVFEAAVEQELYILAVLGVLTSVVAAYYYLRIVKVMFFDEPLDSFDKGMPFARRAVLCIAMIFVVGFVVKPAVFLEKTQSAAASLFSG